MNKFSKLICGFIVSFLGCICYAIGNVSAASSFSMSPMNQKISIAPGDTYYGTVTIVNPADNTTDLIFSASAQPFKVTDNNFTVALEDGGTYSQIANWTKVIEESGVIAPNSSKDIHFTISVPENAPAGGQYVAIVVKNEERASGSNVGLNINQKIQIAHLIYAEILGETVHSGEISESNVSSFLLNGNITGSTLIANKGNVHGDAKTYLQVFPLFSNEEIYTNEENPQSNIVLPDTSRYITTEWDETPSVGIFNVIYTAEFEGVTTQVKKMVIICPIWLLAIIIFVLLLIIFWIIAKARSRKKK